MLKDTIIKFLKLEGFIENLTSYFETRVELLKLEMREDIAKSISKLSIFFLLAFAFVVFILFISLALAFWIAGFTGTVGGFSIVGGLYLLLVIILLLLKGPISKTLEKKIVEIIKKK